MLCLLPSCSSNCFSRVHSVETPGEDPLTNGAYGTEIIRGMQGNATSTSYMQISACAKHFVAHSWNSPSHYMATVTPQDLADTYSVPFKHAVIDGEVSSLMCR